MLAAVNGPRGALSWARVFGLLIRLRFARLCNLGRYSLRRGPTAQAGRRAPTARGSSDLGILLLFALLVALFCLKSFNVFEGIARERGADAVQGRANLLSSLLIFAVLLLSAGGSGAVDDGARGDLDWLMTLPAPAWVLHTAKLAEAAVFNTIAWALIFPFFTGLGLHAGLGVVAPLVALGFCLPVFALSALLQSMADAASRWFSSAPLLRAARALATALGALALVVWFGAPMLARFDVLPLGRWLDFSAEVGWLPFSEPARIITSLPTAPARALAWLALFAVEAGGLLGLGAFVLRNVHEASFSGGPRARRRVRASEPVRRFAAARLAGAVVTKDWLWLSRNPARSAGLLFNGVLASGAAALWVSRSGAAPAPALLGATMFAVGLWQLLLLSVLLELERPALLHLAALPRSLSRLFRPKAVFAAALAGASTLPFVGYISSLPSRFGDALPALLYAAAGVVLFAFLQTALWLRRVNPSAATSPLRHTWRSVQLVLLAGFFAAGFGFSTLDRALPLLVFTVAFTFTFWHDSVARLPFQLDPSATRPFEPTASHALVAVVLMRALQVQLLGLATRAGTPEPLALVLSFGVAGGTIVGASLLWFRHRGASELRASLGLGFGRGLGTTLREGLLWSLPAVALTATLTWSLRRVPGLIESLDVTPQDHLWFLLADSSALAFVGMTTVAAPLVEELLFRGMLYRALRSRWGVVLSLLLTSAVFVAIHPRNTTIPVLCMAACATLAFERSRSLFAAILVHATYNAYVTWTVFQR